MSFEGQVDWKRMLMGPCALTIAGKPSVAAPVVAATAPVRNLRRELLILVLLLLWLTDSITLLSVGSFRPATRKMAVYAGHWDASGASRAERRSRQRRRAPRASHA